LSNIVPQTQINFLFHWSVPEYRQTRSRNWNIGTRGIWSTGGDIYEIAPKTNKMASCNLENPGQLIAETPNLSSNKGATLDLNF